MPERLVKTDIDNKKILLCLITTAILVSPTFAVDFNTSSEFDRIRFLPGQNDELKPPTYSGYLRVSGTLYFHYVFVESETAPSKAPIILWVNGGPGCSSLVGTFLDNGPWKVSGEGNLEPNPFSWTKFANMLYIETPVWTGFTYGSTVTDITTSDDKTAFHTVVAIKLFLERFSQFRSNEFYLVGLSYAGVSIPIFSSLLIREKQINFRGFAIGNGYLDQSKLGNSIIHYAYDHGLIDWPKWALMKQMCCRDDEIICNFINGSHINLLCKNLVFSVVLILGKVNGINPYNVKSDCKKDEQFSIIKSVRNLAQIISALDTDKLLDTLDPLQSCEEPYETSLSAYLNDPEVRRSLRVPLDSPEWKPCNRYIALIYHRQYSSVKDQVKETLEAGVKGLIYNGDLDLICDHIGNGWFADDLGLKNVSDWTPWHFGDQVAGQTKTYDGLRLVTLHGAGHHAIRDKPKEVFELIRAFVNNQDLEQGSGMDRS